MAVGDLRAVPDLQTPARLSAPQSPTWPRDSVLPHLQDQYPSRWVVTIFLKKREILDLSLS